MVERQSVISDSYLDQAMPHNNTDLYAHAATSPVNFLPTSFPPYDTIPNMTQPMPLRTTAHIGYGVPGPSTLPLRAESKTNDPFRPSALTYEAMEQDPGFHTSQFRK